MGNHQSHRLGLQGHWEFFLENELQTGSWALRPPPPHLSAVPPTRALHLLYAHTGLSGRATTFMEGVRGQAGDLGHDREQMPQTGPLGLPALEDSEGALAHASDLLSVTLHTEHGVGVVRQVLWSENTREGAAALRASLFP